MKIGFCVSGQPRLNDAIIENHKELLKNENIISFMHLWWNDKQKGKIIRYHSSERYPDRNLDEIALAIYKPIMYLIEDYKDFDISFLESFNKEHWLGLPYKFFQIFTPWILYSNMCQSYSVMISTSLCYESKLCDISMRMRADTIFTSDIVEILKGLKPEKNYIYFQSSMSGGHKYSGEFPNNPCDWFYCGLPETVAKFSRNWFELFPIIYRKGIIHATDAMKEVARLSDLKIILLDFGVIVERQLRQNDPNFVPWQKYLDDFDSESMRVIRNIDDWPLWISKVNFEVAKNLPYV